MKTNNPSNQISQSAKEAGLSYWEYIAKTQPHHVQKFVWGVKKETRKEKRDTQQRLIALMTHSSNPTAPMARLFSQMRNLIGKRSAY